MKFPFAPLVVVGTLLASSVPAFATSIPRHPLISAGSEIRSLAVSRSEALREGAEERRKKMLQHWRKGVQRRLNARVMRSSPFVTFVSN